MKFITEDDLRDLYRKEPFTAYNLEPGARITPGGRQFLADRGISMPDNSFSHKKKDTNPRSSSELSESKKNINKLKLYSKMKSIEALFFLTEEELLHRDVILAQSVAKLSKQYSRLKNELKVKGKVENLCCSECTGIKEHNFSDNLDDCFDITGFHMQLEKGKDILILHRLRCVLQEIEPVALEQCFDCNQEKELCEDIIGKVNQIINSISQLICSAFGGKKCQQQTRLLNTVTNL